MKKSIRIESNGTPTGTKVFDAESGQRLHGITKITWEIGVDQAGTATVTFILPEIVATGVVDVTGLGEHLVRYQKAGEPYSPPTDKQLATGERWAAERDGRK